MTIHASPVRYWINAAREQSRWYVQLRKQYRCEAHAKKRAALWEEGNRCRDRVAPLMREARRTREHLAPTKNEVYA